MRKPLAILLFVGVIGLLAINQLTLPIYAADTMKVITEKEEYNTGENVAISLAFMGRTHGTIELMVYDENGVKQERWSWSHTSETTYKKSVTWTPSQPGIYEIRGSHEGHHGEGVVEDAVKVKVSGEVPIPEFPVTTIPPLLIALTVMMQVVRRNRRLNK